MSGEDIIPPPNTVDGGKLAEPCVPIGDDDCPCMYGTHITVVERSCIECGHVWTGDVPCTKSGCTGVGQPLGEPS